MKKILLLSLFMIGSGTFFVSSLTAQAQTNPANGPVLLAPLPGTFDPNTAATGPQTTLRRYLPGVFSLAIAFSALLAVIVIIFAGLEYMFSTSSGGTGKARERIKSAVIGLIMVLAAWLILKTINPKLVAFDLNIQTANVDPGPPPPTDTRPLCSTISDTPLAMGSAICPTPPSGCPVSLFPYPCPVATSVNNYRSCNRVLGICRD